jgi:hypothetical protein
MFASLLRKAPKKCRNGPQKADCQLSFVASQALVIAAQVFATECLGVLDCQHPSVTLKRQMRISQPSI